MLILGILMLVAVLCCAIAPMSGSSIVAFLAKAGGLFAFLWFCLLLVKFLMGQSVPSL